MYELLYEEIMEWPGTEKIKRCQNTKKGICLKAQKA